MNSFSKRSCWFTNISFITLYPIVLTSIYHFTFLCDFVFIHEQVTLMLDGEEGGKQNISGQHNIFFTSLWYNISHIIQEVLWNIHGLSIMPLPSTLAIRVVFHMPHDRTHNISAIHSAVILWSIFSSDLMSSFEDMAKACLLNN